MSALIFDEFTFLPISRQQKSQLRRQREGNCIICGKQRERYSHRCNRCHAKTRRRENASHGYKPWHPAKHP